LGPVGSALNDRQALAYLDSKRLEDMDPLVIASQVSFLACPACVRDQRPRNFIRILASLEIRSIPARLYATSTRILADQTAQRCMSGLSARFLPQILQDSRILERGVQLILLYTVLSPRNC